MIIFAVIKIVGFCLAELASARWRRGAGGGSLEAFNIHNVLYANLHVLIDDRNIILRTLHIN